MLRVALGLPGRPSASDPRRKSISVRFYVEVLHALFCRKDLSSVFEHFALIVQVDFGAVDCNVYFQVERTFNPTDDDGELTEMLEQICGLLAEDCKHNGITGTFL